MAIPAKPPVHVEPTLVSKPGDNVLYSAGQNVAVMWETSRKGRSIVERVPVSRNTHNATAVIHNPTKTRQQYEQQTQTQLSQDSHIRLLKQISKIRFPLTWACFWIVSDTPGSSPSQSRTGEHVPPLRESGSTQARVPP